MGEAAPCYHWLDCRTGAVAARVAGRLSQAEGYPWSDRERWAIRFGRVGRGALYQAEVVGRYHSPAIGWWIREAVPEARVIQCADDGLEALGGPGAFLAGFDHLVPDGEGAFDLQVAADLLHGAVADLGGARTLCLREGIVVAKDEPRTHGQRSWLFWPDLSATQASPSPLARLFEALLLAAPREGRKDAWFVLGSHSPDYGCVYTGRLRIRCLRATGWVGGDASILLGGEDNALHDERTFGPDFWAFGPSPRSRPPLPDDNWPFRGP